MKITFHGAAKEVGRSCIEIKTNKQTILLDAGLKITELGDEYPIDFPVDKISAVFISHAHLDHIGALPLFDSKGMQCPIYCTHETKQISEVLLNDSLHIEMMDEEFDKYSDDNILNVLHSMQKVTYNSRGTFSDMEYQYFDAGHIPGSASILLKVDGMKLLYTGDINLRDTILLNHADTSYGANIDVMICESTYGNRDHPGLLMEEVRFMNAVFDTLKKKGTVIVPVFGVGRAQEVMMMLAKRDLPVQVYFDGMGKKINEIFLSNQKLLRNPAQFRTAISKVEFVDRNMSKREIASRSCIIVTTAGMMTGGPVVEYMKSAYDNPNNSILLTGYQSKGTGGHMLMNERRFDIDGKIVRVKAHVDKFDFSAHCGHKELIQLITKVRPKMLILNHGDKEAIESLGAETQAMGIETHVPELGDSFEVQP